MKLSHQHDAQGLAGYLRNPVTGELMHFELLKGKTSMYLQAVLGDKHLEGRLMIERIPTDDPSDDIDLQIRIDIPTGPVGENLDVKPPRPDAPRYDVDGMPMIDGPVPAEKSDKGDIQERGPDLILEPVRTPGEREREAAEDAARREAADALSADVDGAPMEGEKTPPAKAPEGKPIPPSDPTAVPPDPKRGYQDDPKRHVDEWEIKQGELDKARAAAEESVLSGKKKAGKAAK
jgi:hypothetical protein